jgi:hypothetical protein
VARDIPDPIDDQPPACIFISTVDDEITADRKRFTAVLPKLRLPPRRYWEEALQEDPDDYPISLGEPHE